MIFWKFTQGWKVEKRKRENSEKVKGRRISFPALAPHNIAADCTDWASLSRVATPLKDPNQQNKYRDPPNIYIIPNFRFKKSNNIYVLYISCTGKQEMRINLRQKRIKWCLLWPAQNGGYSPEQATYSGAHKITLKKTFQKYFI